MSTTDSSWSGWPHETRGQGARAANACTRWSARALANVIASAGLTTRGSSPRRLACTHHACARSRQHARAAPRPESFVTAFPCRVSPGNMRPAPPPVHAIRRTVPWRVAEVRVTDVPSRKGEEHGGCYPGNAGMTARGEALGEEGMADVVIAVTSPGLSGDLFPEARKLSCSRSLSPVKTERSGNSCSRPGAAMERLEVWTRAPPGSIASGHDYG